MVGIGIVGIDMGNWKRKPWEGTPAVDTVVWIDGSKNFAIASCSLRLIVDSEAFALFLNEK